MTEIAIRPATAPNQALSLAPMNPMQAWKFAEWLAQTPLLPDVYRNQPASVLWALEYGRALGLDVVTTITTIHVIKGKPSQSADLMLSRTRAAGHKVRINSTSTSCSVSIWRHDDPEFENRIVWTIDDAVTANLCTIRNDRPYSRSKQGEPQSWEKYPRAMLRNRAISECVRAACPEVLHGAIYTPEELGAGVDSDGQPQEVQPVRATFAEAGDWAAPPAPPAVTPEAQTLATKGAAATDKVAWRQVWADAACAALLDASVTAPDTGQPDQLGAYLTRTGQDLPDAAGADDGVLEGVVVDDADDLAAARAEMLDAALALGFDAAAADAEFAKSYGHPIAEAPASELREMRDLLIAGAS